VKALAWPRCKAVGAQDGFSRSQVKVDNADKAPFRCICANVRKKENRRLISGGILLAQLLGFRHAI